MHILVAPNAFKNSLSAGDAANAIAKGLSQSRLDCSCERFPVGDGGDGTASLLIEKRGGRRVTAEVHDPLGRKFFAEYGLVDDDRVAIIEMATASGLRLLSLAEQDPLKASSFGTGELIKNALDQGVGEIVIGLGGSATVDGGVGILQALGIRFLDAAGDFLSNLPEGLINLNSIDLSGLDQRMAGCALTVLCDVENPLLGEQGAARVFGQQKGATAEGIDKLEAALARLSEVVFRQTGKEMASRKYGGAAGGVAAGLQALLNANLVSGIDYFLDATDFNAALQKADFVITGEGSIDEQTLHGKAPLGVVTRAKRMRVPVIALAGAVPMQTDDTLEQYFDLVVPIGNAPVDLESALRNTAMNLERTARELGNALALGADLFERADS